MMRNDGIMIEEETKYCVDIKKIKHAAKRIEGIAHRTPVLTSSSINTIAKRNLFFKVEAMQKTGSFKFRGALNAVKSVLQEHSDGEVMFVSHSSGNHAQALALAAKLSGKKATIVMPNNTPSVKKAAVSDFGASIVMVENTNEAREDKATDIVNESGGVFIHPSEDPRVIAGQGTVCIEFLEQMGDFKLDAVIIPVGGGGLAAGNIITMRSLQPNVKIILGEPSMLDDAYRSFRAKKLLKHEDDNTLDSVADGLKTTLGPNTWPIVRDKVDDIFTVTEKEILQATKLIWERLKVTIEPSAGVGVAVAMSEAFVQKYGDAQNVGVILCGGNVDIIKIAAKMQQHGID